MVKKLLQIFLVLALLSGFGFVIYEKAIKKPTPQSNVSTTSQSTQQNNSANSSSQPTPETKTQNLPGSYDLKVPFVAQAPVEIPLLE